MSMVPSSSLNVLPRALSSIVVASRNIISNDGNFVALDFTALDIAYMSPAHVLEPNESLAAPEASVEGPVQSNDNSI
ncbi:hypothetical protein V6N11_082754 [Hibiscus sabdariffa]|uniref:Uncharacterized protein n=1 Tax=Hibiscus sabdariffa TaxID=183260 RepID=A0ABR2QJU8_9ROSI